MWCFGLSATQAKTVHTAVFLLLRSRDTSGGEKCLVEHIGVAEPGECTLYIEGECSEPVGRGRRHVYGGEQNHREELTVKEQSAKTEHGSDSITDYELVLRRDVRASERVLDVKDAVTFASQFLHYLG